MSKAEWKWDSTKTWIDLFSHVGRFRNYDEPLFVDIPCWAVVTRYVPYTPARTSGPPELCYEAEGGEVEFYLAWKPGGPESEFLMKHCSNQRFEDIHEQLLNAYEQ